MVPTILVRGSLTTSSAGTSASLTIGSASGTPVTWQASHPRPASQIPSSRVHPLLPAIQAATATRSALRVQQGRFAKRERLPHTPKIRTGALANAALDAARTSSDPSPHHPIAALRRWRRRLSLSPDGVAGVAFHVLGGVVRRRSGLTVTAVRLQRIGLAGLLSP